MDLQSLGAAVLHGVGLISLAVVIGGLLLEQFILPPNVDELAVPRRRIRRLLTTCLVVLMLTTIGDLLVRAQSMTRAALGTAIIALPEIVTRTHVGWVLTARSIGLMLAMILSLARATVLRVLFLFVALSIALTTSLAGHAADWGDLTVSTAVDWTHVVAASAWIGGLCGLAFIVLRGIRLAPPASLVVTARRFSRLAAFCLLAVVSTGIYNAWLQLETLSRLWSTTYGRVLIVKLLLVATVVWFGAVNRYVIIPRLSPDRASRGTGTRLFRVLRLVIFGPSIGTKSHDVASHFSYYVACEALLAVAVFACTGALGEVTPGRHTTFERKPTSHVTPVEARSSASASRVGTVTPPPGNAARGRAVFIGLRCFACHAVGSEVVPAPSQRGPDLTGIGRRHPGYLVESVLNPNAMIVDGPSYTDARGLSIMPDYRNKLTVGDLIDLVAYLKTL
jgi:copper resistance protein D